MAVRRCLCASNRLLRSTRLGELAIEEIQAGADDGANRGDGLLDGCADHLWVAHPLQVCRLREAAYGWAEWVGLGPEDKAACWTRNSASSASSAQNSEQKCSPFEDRQNSI